MKQGGSTEQSDFAPLGEVFEFMRLIWTVHHSLQRTSKHMEALLGITGPQRLVLRIVGRFPGIPAGQLAEILRLHPSTMTGILKRLQRRGFLHRRKDPKDARRALLGLTPKGRQLDVETRGTVEDAVKQTLASVPGNHVQGARKTLSHLAALLDQDVDASADGGRGHHAELS
jgi:DNA-binding MarR family transcriptional regulator